VLDGTPSRLGPEQLDQACAGQDPKVVRRGRERRLVELRERPRAGFADPVDMFQDRNSHRMPDAT
jgi:hypothetical protein